jgi:membrane protease YdiL (CAAX protease family)
LWWQPLAEGYLNHFYSYELFGRIVYAIILCVIFPVVEEIYFRGLLLPVISLRFGVGNGAILSVIIFILYHMTSKGVLSLALLGGVSTWLVIRTKTIISSIAMHITFNSVWLIHGVITVTK